MSLLALLILLGWAPTAAQAEVISPFTVEYSTTTAPLILNAFAAKYKIDFEEFLATAQCESRMRADAVGDNGTSFGVFQIHLPAHPSVTRKQALDPWWATEWAARQFAAGRQSMWTCWRMLYS